jgi:hypothetical protein
LMLKAAGTRSVGVGPAVGELKLGAKGRGMSSVWGI